MSDDEDWRISEVDALPWPHHLFRCPLHAHIADALEAMENVADQQAATRELALSLSAAEVATCPYHLPDWKLAADTAVALVERTGQMSIDDLDQAARTARVDDETAEAMLSFVDEPVTWNGGDQLGNGQHRVCAMKLTGVRRCPHVER